MNADLREIALQCLAICDVQEKVDAVNHLDKSWAAGEVTLETSSVLISTAPIPGRPDKPELVSPLTVKRRAMNTPEGRAAMVHALAHIEFNAINLALDALWRFPNMPRDYYTDWLQVAVEEALHFSLLAAHLNTQGFAYGDFVGHDGLWDMALRTQHDVLERMALLPRTMEARGLDVTPGTKAKLVQAGDHAIAPILDIVMRDEIGHVSIGNRWFNYLCEQRGLTSSSTYAKLVAEHNAIPRRGPFNLEARRAAGFSEEELVGLGKS
ncbi:MAG: ferritin-like domain-containing protein [Sideroxydans sp.]|nr:ferritin-like domain-containing protein [Sideroxydans sp.]